MHYFYWRNRLGFMVNLNLNKDLGYAILSVNGPIAKKDIEELTQEVDHYLEDHDTLAGLIIKAKKFPGWENLDSFIKHIKFVKDHHQDIEKVGFISEDNILQKVPELANHFVNAELKQFGDGKMDEATEWILSGN